MKTLWKCDQLIVWVADKYARYAITLQPTKQV